jgi:hypothetical protein
MAPKPIEKLLRVLWTFFSDMFILPWSYKSKASKFLAERMYLPFEILRNERPTLSDQILKLLLAPWRFFSDMFILPWSYESKAVKPWALEMPSWWDQFLKLLLALWRFVSNIFILLWSSFWAKGTYPSFESFRNGRESFWDQILKLLRALWTFISDLCMAALIYLKDHGPSSHLSVYD